MASGETKRFFRFVDGAVDEIVLCDAFFKRYGGDDAVARAWVQVSHAFCVAAEGCASRLADAEGARARRRVRWRCGSRR